MKMPERFTGLSFQKDTNVTNARGQLAAMGRLKQWADHDVIALYLSERAAEEAARAGARHAALLSKSQSEKAA